MIVVDGCVHPWNREREFCSDRNPCSVLRNIRIVYDRANLSRRTILLVSPRNISRIDFPLYPLANRWRFGFKIAESNGASIIWNWHSSVWPSYDSTSCQSPPPSQRTGIRTRRRGMVAMVRPWENPQRLTRLRPSPAPQTHSNRNCRCAPIPWTRTACTTSKIYNFKKEKKKSDFAFSTQNIFRIQTNT